MVLKNNLQFNITYLISLTLIFCFFITSCEDIVVEADNLKVNEENDKSNNDLNSNNNFNDVTNTNNDQNRETDNDENVIIDDNEVNDVKHNNDSMGDNNVNINSSENHNLNDEENAHYNHEYNADENSFFNNDENSFYNSWFEDENYDDYDDMEMGIKIVLKWNNLETDLILHLVRNDGELGSNNDCFDENPNPEWGENEDEDEYEERIPHYFGTHSNIDDTYSLIHYENPADEQYTIYVTNNLNGNIEDNIDVDELDNFEINYSNINLSIVVLTQNKRCNTIPNKNNTSKI